jgi:aryl-alcohol dehydrogenase-like predicted oxidoreductase
MCLDFGLNMFDSADVYSAGLAEEILGAAIKGKRDRVIVQVWGPSAENFGKLGRKGQEVFVEGALRQDHWEDKQR